MFGLRLLVSTVLPLSLALFAGPHFVSAGDLVRTSAQPLTPERIELVAQKEQARALDPRAAGTSANRAQDPAGPETPSRLMPLQVLMSKEEMRRRFEESRSASDRYIAALDAQGAATAAQAERAERAAEKSRIESFPDGEFTVRLDAIESGTHSVSYTVHAYLSDGTTKKDPISFLFFNSGSSWDVYYDLQNWTTPLWNGEGVCGSDLWAYTWDAQHGGSDGWEKQDYHLQYDAGVCGTARYHVRLWDRGFLDTHGNYGQWSFSEPHHDRAVDHCVDDWEGSQEVLRQSFIDGSGNKHFFVGAMYQVSFGNGGTYGCATADGWGWYVELVY